MFNVYAHPKIVPSILKKYLPFPQLIERDLTLPQKFLNERNESVMDFFQALDKDRTMKVSTSDFRKAVKVRLATCTANSIHQYML